MSSLNRPVVFLSAAALAQLALMTGAIVLAPHSPVAAAALVTIGIAAAALSARQRTTTGGDVALRELTQRLQQAAAGDLRVTVALGHHGELGKAEDAADQVVARLRLVAATVLQSLAVLHQGRTSVSGFNKQMLDAAETTAGEAYDVGLSAREVSNEITVVAAATEELIASVDDIARHAIQAADIATDAAGQSQSAETSVRALSSAMEQVGNLAKVIT